ncbi:MAG: hypothetical protein H0X45_10845 [Planctomycetes bacterium]|nr:hypothetical protein [Planctomycetota bacterium]
MNPPLPLEFVLTEIQGINELVFELRENARRLHPDMPEAPFEKQYREDLAAIRDRFGIDLLA